MAIGPSGTAVGKMIEGKKKKKMPFGPKAKDSQPAMKAGPSKAAGMKLMNAREM